MPHHLDPLRAGQASIRCRGSDPPHQHEWLYTNTASQHENTGKMLTGSKGTGPKPGRQRKDCLQVQAFTHPPSAPVTAEGDLHMKQHEAKMQVPLKMNSV